MRHLESLGRYFLICPMHPNFVFVSFSVTTIIPCALNLNILETNSIIQAQYYRPSFLPSSIHPKAPPPLCPCLLSLHYHHVFFHSSPLFTHLEDDFKTQMFSSIKRRTRAPSPGQAYTKCELCVDLSMILMLINAMRWIMVLTWGQFTSDIRFIH